MSEDLDLKKSGMKVCRTAEFKHGDDSSQDKQVKTDSKPQSRV